MMLHPPASNILLSSPSMNYSYQIPPYYEMQSSSNADSVSQPSQYASMSQPISRQLFTHPAPSLTTNHHPSDTLEMSLVSSNTA